ncbi:MAG: hypothetical protein E7179_04035 [Erysipelotrichaceae bacterium]|jgi:hypothetical protein|nr:hypothetical protein [Erysipelotrichaceae bacterium]
MLFFRKFIHDYLPSLLIMLGVLVFCLYSFGPVSASLNQYSVLRKCEFQEKVYADLPYENPSTGEKKDAFADFAGISIVKTGKYSLSSDILMVLPGFTYTEVLPFYVSAMNSLNPGEAMVSKNVMGMRRLKVGDTLVTNDKDDGTFKIVGELPAMKGFEHEHYGIVLLGHNAHMEEYLRSVKPRYVSFSKKFGAFGPMQIEGNIRLKSVEIEKAAQESWPRFAAGVLVCLLAPIAVGLVFLKDDQRKKRQFITSGSSRWGVFYRFLLEKGLYRFLPPFLIVLVFFLMNLTYPLAAASMLLAMGLSLLVSIYLQSSVLTWRK